MGGMCASKAVACKNNPCPEGRLDQCGRGLAPDSHVSDDTCINPQWQSETQQKARLIIDQPGFFTAPEKTYFFKP